MFSIPLLAWIFVSGPVGIDRIPRRFKTIHRRYTQSLCLGRKIVNATVSRINGGGGQGWAGWIVRAWCRGQGRSFALKELQPISPEQSAAAKYRPETDNTIYARSAEGSMRASWGVALVVTHLDRK